MRKDDESYYRSRALQEQLAAQKAMSASAREAHDQLAIMYRFRAAMLSTGPGEWAGALQDARREETLAPAG